MTLCWLAGWLAAYNQCSLPVLQPSFDGLGHHITRLLDSHIPKLELGVASPAKFQDFWSVRLTVRSLLHLGS